MVKADYANAVEKYRQAIDLEPSSVPLRFALGTAYSFRDKRLEAIAQFRWVVANGDRRSAEYRDARGWLVRVGALVEPVAAGERTSDSASFDNGLPKGRIAGKTEWPGVSPHKYLYTGNLTLIGDEPATQDVKRARGFRLGDAYEFRDVPPGKYRVVAVIDEKTLWDQKVQVEAGQQADLVLTQASSPVTAQTFPPEGPKPQ